MEGAHPGRRGSPHLLLHGVQEQGRPGLGAGAKGSLEHFYSSTMVKKTRMVEGGENNILKC